MSCSGKSSVVARLSVVALGVLICVVAPPAASGSPRTAAVPVLSTQTIVGSGAGFGSFEPLEFPRWWGTYTSTSQLAGGHYEIGFIGDTYTGTSFTRSDGMKLTGAWDNAEDGSCGPLPPDVRCLAVDLSESADVATAHLLLAVAGSEDTTGVANPSGFLMRGTLTLRRRLGGYTLLDASGTTYAFGGLDHLGDAHTSVATDVELTPSHRGQWIVNAAGQAFGFGDAPPLGDANTSAFAPGETVTNMSATPTGKGYWLFTSRGRALPFGDARFLGDLHAVNLNGRIVGSVATPTGKGYYMVGTDGGVFAFGDAAFHGSTGNLRLNRPVVGLVPTPDNQGYWLVAADGRVFSFNAVFHGSMGDVALNRPIVAMVLTAARTSWLPATVASSTSQARCSSAVRVARVSSTPS
jgi:hypothetical protein